MRKQGYILIVALLLTAGCSTDSPKPEQAQLATGLSVSPSAEDALATETLAELARMQASVSNDSGGRFLWDQQDRPYTVIEFTQKDYPSRGIQHRSVRAVLPAPDARATAETAVKEIYEILAADIDRTQPDARFKRINILMYDSLADGKAHDGGQIVQASTEAGPRVPQWEEADVKWHWRDPQHRPPAAQLALFHEYWSALDHCTEVAEEPFHDAEGFFTGTPEDQAEIDQRFAIEQRKLINRLNDQYEITEMELSTQIARVWLWRHGTTATPEKIAERAMTYREQWSAE